MKPCFLRTEEHRIRPSSELAVWFPQDPSCLRVPSHPVACSSARRGASRARGSRGGDVPYRSRNVLFLSLVVSEERGMRVDCQVFQLASATAFASFCTARLRPRTGPERLCRALHMHSKENLLWVRTFVHLREASRSCARHSSSSAKPTTPPGSSSATASGRPARPSPTACDHSSRRTGSNPGLNDYRRYRVDTGDALPSGANREGRRRLHPNHQNIQRGSAKAASSSLPVSRVLI